jgi:hypothetical protein
MKNVVVLLLLLVSTNVFAEWTEVSGNDVITSYADFGTIKRKGNKVKMWSLLDLKTIQKGSRGERYLSSVSRDEYDCEEETERPLDIHWYSSNMGQGENVWSSTIIKNEARSVIPRSINETLFKIACGKK